MNGTILSTQAQAECMNPASIVKWPYTKRFTFLNLSFLIYKKGVSPSTLQTKSMYANNFPQCLEYGGSQ